jgi:hypothetical protein
MAYDAAGMWKPEDDSSAAKLTGMLSTDSPYLEQARVTGQQQAQSRGLLNSTIAGQAGEAARIAAAQPFALQDAAATAQKNLSFQGFGQQASLDSGNNAAAQTRLTQQIASNETISDRDAQNKLALQQLQNDAQAKIANMNVSANSQDKAQAAATNASSIYTQNINAIIGNANIPADARQTLMDNAKNQLNANIAMIEQIYNLDLDWSGAGQQSGAGLTGSLSNWGTQTAQSGAAAGANYGGSNSLPANSTQVSQQLAKGEIPVGFFSTGTGGWTDGTSAYDDKGNYLGPAGTFRTDYDAPSNY